MFFNRKNPENQKEKNKNLLPYFSPSLYYYYY